jgi:hypothetical protein
MTISEVEKKVVKSSQSKTYLLPLLAQHVDIEFSYLLLNCFIKFNKHMDDIQYPLGVLYELEDTTAFAEYNEYLINNPLFVRSFIINENNKLYVFKFPDEFLSEYKLFKEGKYSKFNSEAKKQIIAYSIETYRYPPLIMDITGVLWKHKSRREKIESELGMRLPEDSELASKIVYDKETFYFID